jgi:hypothetical protein
MSTLSESIVVSVPVQFADREWSEFMFRRLVGHYMTSLGEITWGTSGDESDADSGIVRFVTEGDRLAKVTVELEYEPHSWADSEAEEETVRKRLREDLHLYRDFLVQRCREEGCLGADKVH